MIERHITRRAASLAAWITISSAVAGVCLLAQGGLPNPYRPVKGLADGGGSMVPGGEWARLPGGREMGPPASVYVDIDGESIWAVIRCDETDPVTLANGGRFGIDCLDRNGRIKNIDTVYKFDKGGNVVKSFGAAMFIWPHGLHVDRDGNVWVTDGASKEAVAMAAKAGGRFGHRVVKFNPDGKVLMTLGEAGVAGSDQSHFMSPSSVAVAANGDIFVADGHGVDENNRVVKYSKDGTFIKAWGTRGSAPGEFNLPHSIAIDSRGRIFVADRSNSRVQIFDQDGKFIDQWKQFGRPSGIYIDRNDNMVVADSQSNSKQNPGFKRGIYVGSARDGKVTALIPFVEPDPEKNNNAGVEGVAIDAKGNVYGAEVSTEIFKKYVKASATTTR